MRRTYKTPGFTLIELMIALAVAALLFAWAVPSFQQFMNRATLSSETNSWVGVINFARSESITRGERVTVCRRVQPENCDGTADCDCGVAFSGGSSPPNYHTGYMIFTSTNNTGTLNFRPGLDNELIRTGRAPSGKVAIQGNGQANNAFSFMPNGTLHPDDASSPTARHILCAMAQAGNDATAESSAAVPGRVVIVSATGRPRVVEFEEGGACFDSDSSNSAADDATAYGD